MENENGFKKLEERVDELERVLVHALNCLGLQLIKGPDGRNGYKIPKVGPPEGWGVLAKILTDLGEIKNEKRIIVPGRQ